MDELILSGAIEIASIDSETGDFLYTFTPKLRHIMPNLWDQNLEFVFQEVIDFQNLGFLHVEKMDSKNPIITLTSKAFDKKETKRLSPDKQQTMKELVRLFE